PVIPPTPARVARMLATVRRPPAEVVAVLAPRDTPATLEALAINAVMAGCLPEYFRVLVAAVEAIGQPEFGLGAVSTTTCGTALFCLVNGPVRQQIDLNSSYGVLGPGWRANATIGRALRLVVLNVAGAVPREISQSTMGTPGRYTLCAGEFEERSPWTPFHVDRGFEATDSAVTVIAVTGTLNIVASSKTAEELLIQVAHSIDVSGTNDMARGAAE